jgi:hypothetical protein
VLNCEAIALISSGKNLKTRKKLEGFNHWNKDFKVEQRLSPVRCRENVNVESGQRRVIDEKMGGRNTVDCRWLESAICGNARQLQSCDDAPADVGSVYNRRTFTNRD